MECRVLVPPPTRTRYNDGSYYDQADRVGGGLTIGNPLIQSSLVTVRSFLSFGDSLLTVPGSGSDYVGPLLPQTPVQGRIRGRPEKEERKMGERSERGKLLSCTRLTFN